MEWDEERISPMVMLSKPPTRPQSAPSKYVKERSSRGRLALLSENHRRAMDIIDALRMDESGSTHSQSSRQLTSAVPAERPIEIFENSPSKNSNRAVSENPAENDVTPAVPPLVIVDSPRRRPETRQATVQAPPSSMQQQSQLTARRSAPAGVSVTPRAPVARALDVDTSAEVESAAQSNPLNANPPAGWCSEDKQQPETAAEFEIGEEACSQNLEPFQRRDRRVKERVHRPKSLLLPECLLSESASIDRSHAASGTTTEQDQAGRRPQSRSEFSESSRPRSRASRPKAFPPTHEEMPRNKTTRSGLAFRDRRPSERIAWQFRSSSPGPAQAAYMRPVNKGGDVARGQLLHSGVTYIGSAHTSIDDPRHKVARDEIKLWPASLRKSVWNGMATDKGTQVPDTGKRVRMLCDSPNLAAELFAQYAIPMRLAGEHVMLLIPFLDCLANLEALEGTSPVLQLALEMTGMKNHQQEASLALISKEQASVVFEMEAVWYSAEAQGAGSGGGSDESANASGRSWSGFFGLNRDKFLRCLTRISESLDDKHAKLLQSMPKMKGTILNKRLPIKDLRELRGKVRRDVRTQDPSPTRRDNTSEPIHSPLASISAMNKEVADPTAKQVALFKALKSQSLVSEYKKLARQVARETMTQLDTAVKTKSRTRKELEWLLVLRDQALTSLGLVVSADQIKRASEAGAAAGPVSDDVQMLDPNNPEEGDDCTKILAWGPPAWAWVVPGDFRKPISPVMDGWYLVSGDTGPGLRLMGPLGSRSKAIKSIPDFTELAITVFNVYLMRDSSIVENFLFDSSGRRIAEAANIDATKADGWYVMIHQGDKLLWTLGLELTQIERDLTQLKLEATRSRKTLHAIQVHFCVTTPPHTLSHMCFVSSTVSGTVKDCQRLVHFVVL